MASSSSSQSVRPRGQALDCRSWTLELDVSLPPCDTGSSLSASTSPGPHMGFASTQTISGKSHPLKSITVHGGTEVGACTSSFTTTPKRNVCTFTKNINKITYRKKTHQHTKLQTPRNRASDSGDKHPLLLCTVKQSQLPKTITILVFSGHRCCR